MGRLVSRISIEQVCAFVELARSGSLHAAALKLCLSAEGLRSRILALEERMGMVLYEKERGRRGQVRLTSAGRSFLDKAVRFLEDTETLLAHVERAEALPDVRIVTSQYVALYLLIDVLRDFHTRFPNTSVHISIRTEQQVVSTMRMDTSFAVGICAPEEFSTDLICRRWTSMNWRLIVPLDSPLLQRPSVTLAELVDEPLIIFEPGSTGRQHILEAFYERGLAPRVFSEVTSTEIAIHLVEARIGIAIVPMLASGIRIQGVRVGQIPISDPIRKIENVIFVRPAMQNDKLVQTFVNYLFSHDELLRISQIPNLGVMMKPEAA